MATCQTYKIDSNFTGLRYTEEECIKQLPETGIVWRQLEPNSYTDFGGQLASVARNPINQSRQRKKGVITDVDASGGFNQDITFNNMTHLLQGFFFADIREKATTAPMNGAAVAITSVDDTDDSFNAASGLDIFGATALVRTSGFGAVANNGVFPVVSAAAGKVVVTGALTAEAAPPAAAKLEVVGRRFAEDAASLELNAQLVRLLVTGVDLTTLGLIRGEWIFLGGDESTSNLGPQGTGFARVSVITPTYIEFDKVSWIPDDVDGTGVSLEIYFGSVLRNEENPDLIKRRTYQVERTLGKDAAGTMSEYLVGAVANELTINVQTADKVNVDLSFVAVDNEQRSGLQGVKPGARPAIESYSAFNTSSDFPRIKLASVDNVDAAPLPMFAFATELTLTINNNVTPNKAIGVTGAFDTSAGTFEVGGQMTAYFASIDAVQAVRNNADVTLDIIMQKKNYALLWDIPLLGLGDGRLNVVQDEPITIPLETNAAESKFGNTLLFQSFAYLPDIAGGK